VPKVIEMPTKQTCSAFRRGSSGLGIGANSEQKRLGAQFRFFEVIEKLSNFGSGGGTRTPDTRIMIPLL
jgi:hypothetical protein